MPVKSDTSTDAAMLLLSPDRSTSMREVLDSILHPISAPAHAALVSTFTMLMSSTLSPVEGGMSSGSPLCELYERFPAAPLGVTLSSKQSAHFLGGGFLPEVSVSICSPPLSWARACWDGGTRPAMARAAMARGRMSQGAVVLSFRGMGLG